MRYDENVPPYKPLSKRSKFAKPNKEGQVANNCIKFCHSGRNGNCQVFDDWQDVNHPCKVCNGEYCENFKGGV